MAQAVKAIKEAANQTSRAIKNTASGLGSNLGFNTRASRAVAEKTLRNQGMTGRNAKTMVESVRGAERAGLKAMAKDATSKNVKKAAQDELKRRNKRNITIGAGVVAGTAGTAGGIAANRSPRRDKAASIANS